MKHSKLTGLLIGGAALIITGCYDGDIDSLQKQIDDLHFSDLKTQVENIDKSVSDLEIIRDGVAPAVESLTEAKNKLVEELTEAQGKLSDVETASAEDQATVLSLQEQISQIEAAIEMLLDANLDSRIDALKDFINTFDTRMDARLGNLETQAQTFATIEALAKVQAVVDQMVEGFDQSFVAALERNQALVVGWVSQSDAIKELFSHYYTRGEMDAKLAILDAWNKLQDEKIESLENRLDSLKQAIPDAIKEAIDGVNRHFSELIIEINGTLTELEADFKDLDSRVAALEKLPAVIGDYSQYKGTLVADIIKLQEILGSDDRDGTLTSLVNTLKLLLTDSEGEYYKLSEIVASLAANTSATQDHEGRIASLEQLAPTLATLDSLNSLKASVEELWSIANQNELDIRELTTKVNYIVGLWTDAVYNQIQQNTSDIDSLRLDVDKLIAAVGSNEFEEETGIYKLIADINNKIAELRIEEMWDNINDVNELLATCHVDDYVGLQKALDNLFGRFKDIWDLIGKDEKLDIEGSIINAINVINARFGNLGDQSVEELIAALRSDLNLIKGAGWTEGLDLSSLRQALLVLQNDLKGKADTTDVNAIGSDVSDIQQTLLTLITSQAVNDTLSYYLLSATAAETYATIASMNEFIASYHTLVGDTDEIPGTNTILGRLLALETALGAGEEDLDWADNLVAAVNTLHGLVGDRTVAVSADSVAHAIIKDLMATLLGDDEATGTDTYATLAAKLAAKIKGFEDEIAIFKNLSVSLGEDGKDGQYGYSQIDSAVEKVYALLQKYVSDYDAAKGTFTTLAGRFEAIEALLGTDFFSTEYTVAAAIDEILDMIGELGDGNSVSGLISTLQGTYDDLIAALVGKSGSSVGDITDSLSLNSLRARLDTLGFGDVKQDGKTLAEALGELSLSIKAINDYTGTGFQGDTTLTSAIRALQDSLGNFSEAGYQNTISGINASIQNLLNALAGLDDGGTIDNVKDLRHKFDTIANLLDSLDLYGKKGMWDILDTLSSRLKDLDTLIGNVELDYTITEKIKEIWDKMEDPDYMNKFLNEELFARLMGLTSIEAQLGTVENLPGPEKNLVSAINFLYGQIVDPVSQADLDAAIENVVGTGTIDYHTIKALSDALVTLKGRLDNELGEMPDDWGDRGTVYEAIRNLQTTLDSSLGENTTEYPTVWAAIADLLRMIGAANGDDPAKGLNELLHSFVYVPQYSDGKAELGCVANNKNVITTLGTLNMQFSINAEEGFFTNLSEGRYAVRALIKPLTSRSDAFDNVKVVDGTISLNAADRKRATVTFSNVNLENQGGLKTNVIKTTESYAIAVQLTDSGDGTSFTAPFVGIAFKNETGEVFSVSATAEGYARAMNNGSFRFYTKANGAKVTLSVKDVLGNGYSVAKTGEDWLTITQDDNVITVVPKDSKAHSGGSVIVTGSTGPKTFTFEELTYEFSLSNVDEDLTLSGDPSAGYVLESDFFSAGTYSFALAIDPSDNGYLYDGGYVINDGGSWATVTRTSGNQFSIALTQNDSEAPRSQAVSILSDNGSGEGVNFTVTQAAKTIYSFALADNLPTGLTKSGNTLTATNGKYHKYEGITLVATPSSPEYAYGFTITKSAGADWISVPSSIDGLSFDMTLETHIGTEARSATLTFTPTDNISASLEVTVVQNPGKFELKLLDVSSKHRLSYDENTGFINAWYAWNYPYEKNHTRFKISEAAIRLDLDGYPSDALTFSCVGASGVSVDTDGNLSFTLDMNKTKDTVATRSISISAADGNENVTPLTLTFKQREICFEEVVGKEAPTSLKAGDEFTFTLENNTDTGSAFEITNYTGNYYYRGRSLGHMYIEDNKPTLSSSGTNATISGRVGTSSYGGAWAGGSITVKAKLILNDQEFIKEETYNIGKK